MTPIVGKATERGSELVDFGSARELPVVSRATDPEYTTPDERISPADRVSSGEEAREKSGWGQRFGPGVERPEARERFSQILQKIRCELNDLEVSDCFVDGKIREDAAGSIAEIAELLETLFDCPFGEGESLKGVVVAVQSQTNNREWTVEIARFLKDVTSFLGARYVVNDQTVNEVYKIMGEHGLDPFRGSVSNRDMKIRYRLARVDQE